MSIPLPINDYHGWLVLNLVGTTKLKAIDVYKMVFTVAEPEDGINLSWGMEVKRLHPGLKFSVGKWVGAVWFARTCFNP